MFEVVESQGAPEPWKRILRVCARCWSACPTSPSSVSASGRGGYGSRSLRTSSGRRAAAGRRGIMVPARLCWWICRCSAGRPGWRGASNAGVATRAGGRGPNNTRRSRRLGVRSRPGQLVGRRSRSGRQGRSVAEVADDLGCSARQVPGPVLVDPDRRCPPRPTSRRRGGPRQQRTVPLARAEEVVSGIVEVRW